MSSLLGTLSLKIIDYISKFTLEIPNIVITSLCEFITTETYLDILQMSRISIHYLIDRIILIKLESLTYNLLIKSYKFIASKLTTQYTLKELMSKYFNIIARKHTTPFFLTFLYLSDRLIGLHDDDEDKYFNYDDLACRVLNSVGLNCRDHIKICIQYGSIFVFKKKFIEYSVDKPDSNKIYSILKDFIDKNEKPIIDEYKNYKCIINKIKAMSLYNRKFKFELFINEDFKLTELFDDLVSIDKNNNVFPKNIEEIERYELKY